MFTQLPAWLYPLVGLMALGALLVQGVVLYKGDLCPGQRARISNELFSLWVMSALSLMLAIDAGASTLQLTLLASASALGVLLSLLQSKQAAKRAIPTVWWALAGVPLAAFGVVVMLQLGRHSVLTLLILGTAFSHLQLLKARHRLQAFNWLLPASALGATILQLLSLALTLWLHSPTMDVASIDAMLPSALVYAGSVLVGLGIWFTPLWRGEPMAPVVVSSALCALLISQTAMCALFEALP
ncbi:MAG: hypothetical protein ACRCYV_06730 [Aeromonas sp.]